MNLPDIYSQDGAVSIPLPQRQYNDDLAIPQIILLWLDEVASKSEKTKKSYEATIYKFRAALYSYGYDLLFTTGQDESGFYLDVDRQRIYTNRLIDFHETISKYAQIFSKMRENGSKPLSQASIAHRLYVLSSFYNFAIRHRYLKEANPIDIIKKDPPPPYRGAEALFPEEIAAAFAAIDLSTEKGLQERALLVVLIETARRVSEVLALRRKDVKLINGVLHLDFPAAKGGKHVESILSTRATEIVVTWLSKFYGNGQFLKMPADTPLWVQTYHTSKRGTPLQYHGVSNIVKKHFGDSRVHKTRHSGALAEILAGGDVNSVQRKLGHASLSTTGIYLQELQRAGDKHQDDIAKMLGY